MAEKKPTKGCEKDAFDKEVELYAKLANDLLKTTNPINACKQVLLRSPGIEKSVSDFLSACLTEKVDKKNQEACELGDTTRCANGTVKLDLQAEEAPAKKANSKDKKEKKDDEKKEKRISSSGVWSCKLLAFSC